MGSSLASGLTAGRSFEWLEADGLGGFASGTTGGVRTRRYHALLLTASTPPTGRMVLVSGFDAFVETAAGRFALSSQRYRPDVVHPDGQRRIAAFRVDPWPTWTFRLEDGTEIQQEIFAVRGEPETVIRFSRRSGTSPCRLTARPFLAGRDHHATHHENPVFDFTPQQLGDALLFSPYPGVPPVAILSNGAYLHDPCWYRAFFYEEEAARGLDAVEDLASPGELSFDLAEEDAWITLRAGGARTIAAAERYAIERARRAKLSRMERAAEAYVVRRGAGHSLIAGYPWFTDWGRDTFIAMRGLCSKEGRLEIAEEILVEWAGAVSEGMLPNRFPDGESAEYNAVDASLWYVVAAHDFFRASGKRVPAVERAILEIVDRYASGTRFGIRMDEDGLLFAGERGVQLTWMDAKVGDYVVTPRIGKPVEVQALWINALAIAAQIELRFAAMVERARASFLAGFWDDERGCLFDVLDADFEPGRVDRSFRCNQIYAVGGLPLPLLSGSRASRLVEGVERRLLTPLGLRSLAPGEEGYRARYQGGVFERDSAYHQGTVWPYLMGAFVEAWLRVRGDSPEQRRIARERFLAPLLAHLDEAGLGHVSEIADAERPHTARGCPFQAWSLAELMRALELTSARS